MSPEERALYFFLMEEMRQALDEEFNKQVLYGNGTGEPGGIDNAPVYEDRGHK